MEAINFNEFSPKERHEIIAAFLVKMRRANSMDNAKSFFDHYLRKFYKLPEKLVNDIVYCQRAMKTHLMMHQTIVNVFGQQADADPVIKNSYLQELEEMLHELNAECQYLVLRLQDDIDRFCSAFTEQQLKPNDQVIRDLVSATIVPLVVANQVVIKPHFVVERPSEKQLIHKYFTVSGDTEPKTVPAKGKASSKKSVPQAQAATDVKQSRLHLQAALKRARSQQQQQQQQQPQPPQKAPKEPPCLVEEKSHDDPIYQTKEYFMQSFGLCTHSEYKRIKMSQIMIHKRKPKLNEKFK